MFMFALRKEVMKYMSDFEVYLEKFCSQHNLTSEEAKEHRIVQEVKAYYEEKEKGVIK